jgi:putative glutamine amidotransferase
MRRTSPVVGLVCDRKKVGDHAFHMVGEKYIDAVRDGSHAIPLLIPALSPPLIAEEILGCVDGLLFTGSTSNVAPRWYSGPPARKHTLLDEARDTTAIPLIWAAEESGTPMLCICRGFQELNVAFGGTLERAVHDQPGRLDHREGDHGRPLEHWYEDRHAIDIVPGGRLAQLSNEATAMVNSLHHQGVERLGAGLRVEAKAPDGLIEAVSVESATQFTLGVQWHPEMRVDDSPLAHAIFTAFGNACRLRQQERLQSRISA